MNTTKQKAKKPAIETLEIAPSIEKKTKKKASEPSSIAEPQVEDSKIKNEVIEPVKSDLTPSNKKKKTVKTKVVRDSFSFPEQDYLKIYELKKTCLAAGVHVKKSEILRAGLHLLTKLNLEELKVAVDQVDKIRTGRPNSSTPQE